MTQNETFKSKFLLIGLALIFALALLMAGCTDHASGASSEPGNSLSLPVQDPTSLPESSAQGLAFLDTANLTGDVTQLLDSGVVVRPAIASDVNGGQLMEQAIGDDDGTEITVIFTADTVFEIVEIDRATYDTQALPATQDDVKKESSVYVWGSYSGTELTADKIAIIRFK